MSTKPNIRVYPRHDDYGSSAKVMEKVIDWWIENNDETYFEKKVRDIVYGDLID